jgi:hypothetical protein
VSGRGGRRPGAGRPPKHVIHETPIRATEKRIVDRLPWIVDKLFELVEGIHEEKVMGENAVIVYKRPPDRQAAEYLIDRVMGKAVQPLDLSHQVEEIAADFGVEPGRVTSIVERLKSKRAG